MTREQDKRGQTQSSAPVQKKSSESLPKDSPKTKQLIGWSTENIFTNFHDQSLWNLQDENVFENLMLL